MKTVTQVVAAIVFALIGQALNGATPETTSKPIRAVLHEPLPPEELSFVEKDTEFEFAANGMIGLESAVPLILGLIREGVLSPLEAIAKVPPNPAAILGVPLGAMLPGMPANLPILDPEETYVLDCSTFRSKSRNCPFHGKNMRGRVLMTLAEGRVAFTRMKDKVLTQTNPHASRKP